jgi:succinate-acetate transporter protein
MKAPNKADVLGMVLCVVLIASATFREHERLKNWPGHTGIFVEVVAWSAVIVALLFLKKK